MKLFLIGDVKLFYFLSGFFSALLLVLIMGGLFTSKNSRMDEEKDFPQNYRIISPEIPNNLEFAGEKVPVGNFEVRERLEREFLVNTYFHSSTLLSIKRANRWFPIIEPILKENNIPDDFKYIALIESNLTNAVSPADAVGFWQLIEGSAIKYGLEVNEEIDERYNVEKSTEAACRFFKDAHEKFGSWSLTAASYNMGTNGMEKQLEKQKANNYYNLVLSDETSRYIFRAIAMKEILKNPKKFGYDIKEEDLYQPLKWYEVELTSAISSFADFALQYGINYKILKFYNPWLRESFLTNKKNNIYKLKIPEKGSIEIIN
jgi:hypothetical protein